MNQPVGEGKETLRDHLRIAALTVEAAAVDLAGPGFPEGCEGLHRLFLDLHAVRTSSGFGANPIGYSEMESYQRLTGCPILPWEVDALRQADAKILELMRERKD